MDAPKMLCVTLTEVQRNDAIALLMNRAQAEAASGPGAVAYALVSVVEALKAAKSVDPPVSATSDPKATK